MADTVPSPNMSMPVPVVATAPGPDWAADINACLSVVDSHTHASGSGVQITPNGLNINADLPFGGNNATLLRTTRFTAQSAALAGASDLGCLYVAGVDLYFNDENGNQIRVTQSGSVSGSTGTITGLPSGTASAAYSAGTFTFQSATSTPAAMSVGPLTFARQVSGSKTVTFAGNVSQASNYTITWPAALPAASNYVYLDSSGNVAYNTSGITGSGALVLAAGPTITSPTFAGTASGTIAGGTYSPTITATTGTGGAAIGSFFYTRVNNTVSVCGSLSGTTSAGGLFGAFISLPVAPSGNFADVNQAKGAASVDLSVTSTLALNYATVTAQTGTQTARVDIGMTTGAVKAVFCYVSFMYSCA